MQKCIFWFKRKKKKHGKLSVETKEFLGRVAAASAGRVDRKELQARLSVAAILYTAQVIVSAERRMGVVHRNTVLSSDVSTSSQATSTTQGRDVAVAVASC